MNWFFASVIETRNRLEPIRSRLFKICMNHSVSSHINIVVIIHMSCYYVPLITGRTSFGNKKLVLKPQNRLPLHN